MMLILQCLEVKCTDSRTFFWSTPKIGWINKRIEDVYIRNQVQKNVMESKCLSYVYLVYMIDSLIFTDTENFLMCSLAVWKFFQTFCSLSNFL